MDWFTVFIGQPPSPFSTLKFKMPRSWPLIAGAAAEVAGQILLDFILAGVGVFPEKRQRVHNKARVAEAALLRTLIGDKGAELGSLLLQPPSSVVTLRPLTRAASTEQDSTGFSSRKTVQRPQLAVSQPRLTLLQPRLRTRSSSTVSAAISAVTFYDLR